MHLNSPPKKQQLGRSKWRLRSIFLVVNLSILLLPLGGLFFFRIYENELLRQTELELITQGAFISSVYRQELREMIDDPENYGIALQNPPTIAVDGYTPITPQVDLAIQETLPPRPDAVESKFPIDTAAKSAAEKASPIFTETQKTTLSGMRLLDFRGTVIGGKEDVGKSFASIDEVQSALQGKYTSVIRRNTKQNYSPALSSISRGTGIRIFTAFPIIENNRLWGIAYLSRSPESILKHLNKERKKVFLAGATILGFALFLTLFTTYMVTRPIHRLIAQAKRVTSGDMSAIESLRRPATKEVELLSESFLHMAETLHSRSEYIRDFAAHVSHEFKTPLTGIQGASELLLEHAESMEPQEREKFLSNILEDTGRLKRLVTRLLELARADNVIPLNEQTDVNALCETLRPRYSKMLNINFDIAEDATIAMSWDNMETILTNLLDNSHQHGALGVDIKAIKNDEFLTITISDDGDGITAANKDKIFIPFFTTRRDTGGTGLGLRIIHSLLLAHGGDIRLADSVEGTSFILHVRLA